MAIAFRLAVAALAATAVLLGSCASEEAARQPASPAVLQSQAAVVRLPAPLAGNAITLQPGDADYDRAASQKARRGPGLGGIVDPLVVRIQHDIDVYRAWSGPGVLDQFGHDGRKGSWWALISPSGTREEYRRAYAICGGNTLAWVTRCHLKVGAVAAVGPGESMTCEGAQGSYPANPNAWQVYIVDAWQRSSDELDCNDADADYPTDPESMSRPVLH